MGWSRTSHHSCGYGTDWDKLRKFILQRDKHLCQACLPHPTPANHVDHIKPKAKGGTDEPSNLQAFCKPCHDAKRRQAREGADRRRWLALFMKGGGYLNL